MMNHISRKEFLATTAGLVLAASAGKTSAQTPGDMTFAERMGYPQGARVLMIHADDAGMCKAANDAIVETFEAGTVTSASIMMTCSWVPAFRTWLEKNPEACAGVHLTFTSEWDDYRWGPVLGRDTVPGLLDANGFLPDSVPEVVASASADEVERELRAQVELAERMGIEVSHMDSHMGTLFATPGYFMRFMNVAIEKQIPMLIAGGHLTEARKGEGEVMDMLKPLVTKVWNAGLPVLDDIDTRSYSWKTTDKVAEFKQLVRDLKPGVTWFNVHPTMPTDEARQITNNRELLWGDYFALTDPELMQVIEDEGVILTSWKELMKRRKAAGDAPLPA
ncbi:MAG: polysaccharide deacetylase family protein [Candidatus Hydrogenedentota bacterium]